MPDEQFPSGAPLVPEEYTRMRAAGEADAFGENLGPAYTLERDAPPAYAGQEGAGYDPNNPPMASGPGEATYGINIGNASNFTDWSGGRGFASDRPQPPLDADIRPSTGDPYGHFQRFGLQQDYENRMRQWQADQMTAQRQRAIQQANPQNQLAELDQQIAQTRLSQPEQMLSARLRQAVAGIQEQLTNGSISPETANLLRDQVQQNAHQFWAREGSLPQMLRRQQYLEAQHQAAMQASIQSMNARHAAQAVPSHTAMLPDGSMIYTGQPNGQALHIPAGENRAPEVENWGPQNFGGATMSPFRGEGGTGGVNEMRGGRLTAGPVAQERARVAAYNLELAGSHGIPAGLQRLPVPQQTQALEAQAQATYNQQRARVYEQQATTARNQWQAAIARHTTGVNGREPVPLDDPANPEWIRQAMQRGPVSQDEAVAFRARQETAAHLQEQGVQTPAQIRARHFGQPAGQQQGGGPVPQAQGPPDQQAAFQRLMQQLGQAPQQAPTQQQAPAVRPPRQENRSWWQWFLDHQPGA